MDRVPDRIGPYTIGRMLGSGGMGQVHAATDAATGDTVAIKFVREGLDDLVLARFRREVESLRRIQSRHVVRYLGHELAHVPPYLVTALIHGETLASVIDGRRRAGRSPWPLPETLRWSIGLARGLAAVHGAGIVHRDVKPGNVIVDQDGEAVVIDLGLTRSERADTRALTETGAILGTLHYLSPEQASAEHVTPASDVYQWGLVVYEMLVGERPYHTDDPLAAVQRRRRTGVPPVGLVDGPLRDLARLVDECLSPAAKDRPVDGGALLARLETAAGSSRTDVEPAAPARSRHPERIGPYVVVREIAHGGMGAVFEGRNPSTGERVALKTILIDRASDPNMIARFRREAALLTRVLSPHVVRLIDYRKEATGDAMVMEFVEGESLADVVRRDRTLEPARALSIVRAVSEGIADLHRTGIVHRDIKPSNVLITARSGPKVVDLGIARDATLTGMTGSGGRVGTLTYMSPEMLRDGASSPASDVYQLGALLFELVTGTTDFRLPDADVQFRRALENGAAGGDRGGVIVKLVELFRACVATEPARRPPDAGDVARRLLPLERAWGPARTTRTSRATSVPAATSDPHAQAPSAGSVTGTAAGSRVRRALSALQSALGVLLVVVVVALAILVAVLIPALTRRAGRESGAVQSSAIYRANNVQRA